VSDRTPLTHLDTAAAGAVGWVDDIERATLGNNTFRKVLFTGEHLQLTVMRLAPGEDVGLEVHPEHDQFIRVEAGAARLDLGPSRNEVTESRELGPDWACIIPAGVWHNVVNVGEDDVRLYSLYAPPEHPPGTVHAVKADDDHDH
jgi:mannose-6-phosphate isomerase-like protein (cupin superfamily)